MNLTEFNNKLEDLRDQRDKITAKLSKLKTKVARSKCFDQIWSIEREARRLFLENADDLFATHLVKGRVKRLGSDYAVIEFNGQTDCVDFSTNSQTKSMYNESACVGYNVGSRVYIKIDYDVDVDRMLVVYNIRRIYGGFVDRTKHHELSKESRPFFIKEGCTGTMSSNMRAKAEGQPSNLSGLFA